MQDLDLSTAGADEIARRVREEIARRRMSRQALADMARVSLSTLEKALAGTRPFTLATALRIEEALGISLRREETAAAPAASVAPDHMGAYARSAVGWIEGDYLTLRPSFGRPGCLFAYVTSIRWLADRGHLGFTESERTDARFEQKGYVGVSNVSGHFYLVTVEQGQHRLAILSRPVIKDTMYGVLTTLEVGHGSQLVPSATVIALQRTDRIEAETLGLIEPGSPAFAEYRKTLETALADDFVRFRTV